MPAPDFPLQLPLGLRFIGFNPNWALGQLQISGYSMGNYTDGANVYRNLATDDREMAYLAVYPDNVPLSHSIVGHPVQCDNPKLVIEFAQLNAKPIEYRVAVNNPTDAPIKTTLPSRRRGISSSTSIGAPSPGTALDYRAVRLVLPVRCGGSTLGEAEKNAIPMKTEAQVNAQNKIDWYGSKGEDGGYYLTCLFYEGCPSQGRAEGSSSISPRTTCRLPPTSRRPLPNTRSA